MTDAAALLRQVLHQVAPEVDTESLTGDRLLQDQVGLDSLDFLNLIAGVSRAAGIDIPERDYPWFATLKGAGAYLARRLAEGHPAGAAPAGPPAAPAGPPAAPAGPPAAPPARRRDAA